VKQEINAMKSMLARYIYKKMYKDNYESISSDNLVISDNVNSTNKRALEIRYMGLNKKSGNYCVVTVESPVREIDSNINKRALKIKLPARTP